MPWFKRGPHRHVGVIWDGYYEYCRCGENAGSQSDPKTGLPYLTFAEWPPSRPYRVLLGETLRKAGLLRRDHDFETIVEADLSHLAQVLEAAGWRPPNANA